MDTQKEKAIKPTEFVLELENSLGIWDDTGSLRNRQNRILREAAEAHDYAENSTDGLEGIEGDNYKYSPYTDLVNALFRGLGINPHDLTATEVQSLKFSLLDHGFGNYPQILGEVLGLHSDYIR